MYILDKIGFLVDCFSQPFPVPTCPWEGGCSLEKAGKISISKENLINTISMGKEFIISFLLKPTWYPGTNGNWNGYAHSVIHFTTNRGAKRTTCKGCRSPGVWISSGHFHIEMRTQGVATFVISIPGPPIGRWSKVEISQTLDEERDVHVFSVRVEGQAEETRDLTDAADYEDVNVFVGDRWSKAQPGFIKELFVSS